MRARRPSRTRLLGLTFFLFGMALSGRAQESKVGERLARRGDEIVVCGQLFHTTTPVVLWTDPGGYDAYRVERRFVPIKEASWAQSKNVLESPNRYGLRARRLSPEMLEKVRGGGWALDDFTKIVDQFVIHYDVAGASRRCFDTLHDHRGLSVHFMLDVDGTIYQTLDLKERAWHATKANDRSIGIEIANIGAYPAPADASAPAPFARWYAKGLDGKTVLTIPGGPATNGMRNPSLPLRPSRDEPVTGIVQGQTLCQYDLTPQQYDALTKLTATLCSIFPKVICDYPKDPSGKLITSKLPDDAYERYHGVLGHYHVQANKVDPGPAFQWDTVLEGARKLRAK
jgi:N-acetylmuramoyl-L-alanine amidase